MAYHARFAQAGQRDRYTGTHGRSGLANAGTATRGVRTDAWTRSVHAHMDANAYACRGKRNVKTQLRAKRC